MKKILFVLIVVCFFCMGASSEVWKHDTVWQSGDHMLFSMYGYKDCQEANTLGDTVAHTYKFDSAYPTLLDKYEKALDKCAYYVRKGKLEGWWGDNVTVERVK
jgi:hypothetical protein